MSARNLVRSVYLPFALRWLLALSCVTCAVIDRNEATDAPPYIVYTSGAVIYRVNINGSSSATVLNSAGQLKPNKVGIDFDYHNGRLFWADSTQLRIMSSSLDGSNVQSVVSSGFRTLERLAYDWVTDKIYWSDHGAAEIGIVDLRTGIRMVLIRTGPHQLSRPRALAIDPRRRNMYWVDRLEENGAALIEGASMDGQNRHVIVDSSLSRPSDITIDIDTNTLYFVDEYFDRIESVNADGSNRQQLHSFRNDVVPFALVFHGGYLYWTERINRMICRLSVEGGTLGNVSVTNVRPAGLAVIAAERQPHIINPCSNAGCSHVCVLSSADVRGFTCVCEEGVQLASDRLTCTGLVASSVVPYTTETPAPSSTANVVLLPTPVATPTEAVPASPTPAVTTPTVCQCMNGGVCGPKPSGGIQCLCPADYSGDLCQKHINETGVCDLPVNIRNPLCKNGATCINTGVFEYYCQCPIGFKGRQCESLVNYGVCNVSKPCKNGGVCYNVESGGRYECQCRAGFTGSNCTLSQIDGDTTASTVENSSSPSVHPSVFVAVVAVFVMLVGILVVVIICVFTLFKRQKEKNKELESASPSRSNSPMIKKRGSQYRSEDTPSSDATSREYWLTSQHSIPRGHPNLYSQSPRRGAPPNLNKYAKRKSYDEISRQSKVLTV